MPVAPSREKRVVEVGVHGLEVAKVLLKVLVLDVTVVGDVARKGPRQAPSSGHVVVGVDRWAEHWRPRSLVGQCRVER